MELIFQQALNSAAAELGRAIASDPSGFANAAEQALGELFGHHHHTGYDTIQDIWDAVEGGHISHSAALQATAILAADLEKRSQRSAQASVPNHPAPGTTPNQSFPLDALRDQLGMPTTRPSWMR